MKKVVIPRSACQAKTSGSRPVAAQADLDVAGRVDVALLDQAVHRRAVRELDAEHLACRCRCGCRSGGARAARGGARRARSAGSVIEWSPPSTIGTAPAATTCPTVSSIAACDASGSAGITGASPKSTARSVAQRVDARLEVRPGRAARRPDRARPVPRAGPVRDEVVDRRADDRDVDPGQLGRILGVREAPVGEQPRVVGLVAESPPAPDRVDHAPIFPRRPSSEGTAATRLRQRKGGCMHCAACGSDNEAGRKFCGECGSAARARLRRLRERRTARGRSSAASAGALARGGRRPTRRPAPTPSAGSSRCCSPTSSASRRCPRRATPRRPASSCPATSSAARTLIERYGGTVEKFIGDAVMAVWGAPVAHEDDAERAVRAALDLVARRPRARPGPRRRAPAC